MKYKRKKREGGEKIKNKEKLLFWNYSKSQCRSRIMNEARISICLEKYVFFLKKEAEKGEEGGLIVSSGHFRYITAHSAPKRFSWTWSTLFRERNDWIYLRNNAFCSKQHFVLNFKRVNDNKAVPGILPFPLSSYNIRSQHKRRNSVMWKHLTWGQVVSK